MRTVMVLSGGLSFERDISLASGRRACNELASQGIEAQPIDSDQNLLLRLQQERPDAVLNLLHGQRGEDGAIAEVLEMANVPYIGPSPAAARIAFDKPTAKELVRRASVATPDFSALPLETFQELGAQGIISGLVAKFGLPLVVKPARGGSALGLSIVEDSRDLSAAMVQCFAYSDTALIERYINGTEIALTIIDEEDGAKVLPIVEIAPKLGRYDYEARYTAGEVDLLIPSCLTNCVEDRVTQVAEDIRRQLDLRDLCRVDMIVDEAGTPYFIEATACPGLTETSVVPAAITASGRTLGQVLASLVERAIARFHGRSKPSFSRKDD